MNCLIHPTYFPNVSHFVAMVKSETIYFELWDNYQKQTYRNRTEIYGANGKLALTVPVVYSQKNRQFYKDVKIANEENWQQQHLKSLQSAYSMSPFYEYYIDDLMPLFDNKYDYLLDCNLKCFEFLSEALQINFETEFTASFENYPIGKTDFRSLAKKNKSFKNLQPYTQVFTEKLGFINNLSILDLLFNEGPNSEIYLKKQTLSH